jgi:protein-disulfide isomerase
MIIKKSNSEINKQDILRKKLEENYESQFSDNSEENLQVNLEEEINTSKNPFDQAEDNFLVSTNVNKKLNLNNFFITFLVLIILLLVVSNIFLWLNFMHSNSLNTSDLQTKLQELEKENKNLKAEQENLENSLLPILNQLPEKSAETQIMVPIPDSKTDNWLGVPEPELVWIVYSDLDCSFCQDLHSNMLALQIQFPEKLSLVYRYYSNSEKGREYAKAMHCIKKNNTQEVFWKILGQIYSTKTPANKIYTLSQEIDQDLFLDCYSSQDSDAELANLLESNKNSFKQPFLGSPTSIFYSTKRQKAKTLVGSLSKQDFRLEIEQLLSKI